MISSCLRQAGSLGNEHLGRRQRAAPACGLQRAVRQRCHQQQWRVFASSAAGSSGSLDGGQHKRLTILHFNDVYNIEPRAVEPVGGASRFAAAARRVQQAEQPLVLFSGDCLNPSLMSAFTRGEQMVPVLNCIGVHAACIGNHDFDFGVATLQKHMQSFRFPWLLSNVLDVRTGEPLGGADRMRIVEWQGVRVGLMGLVEREWLLTIPSIEEGDIEFLDFCTEGRRLAGLLAAEGADFIVALTHMRTPNDLVLAAQVPEIQLVLGGHDHHFEITKSEPHGTLVFKSGTDFREFSVIRLEVPASLADRPAAQWERVEVDSSVPEDPEMAGVVQKYFDLIGTKMDEPLGWTHTPLDARFDTVRRSESNVGSLFADIMRISLGADAAFFNGGTIRSDQVHAAGQLIMRDFVSMLPFTDELVLLELSGADILRALETGVGSLPALEGRFLQVSGIVFAYDSNQPAGSRVVSGSVQVAGQPLKLGRRYKVATKAYLRGGKDGFDSLKGAQVLVDGETNPRLATLVQYLWMRVEYLNDTLGLEWHRMLAAESQRAQREQEEGQEGQEEAGVKAPMATVTALEHQPAVLGSNGSSRSSSGAGSTGREQQRQPVPVTVAASAGHSSSGSSVPVATFSSSSSSSTTGTSMEAAVYAPGAPLSGTATGGPGSIPLAAEQHVHEVTTTGAAISLALLLQQRSEAPEGGSVGGSSSSSGGSSGSGGGEERTHGTETKLGSWLALADDEQRASSTAALSALAYLEPCAHGLDELIVFDAVKRKFGIAPRVEGRITRAPSAGR